MDKDGRKVGLWIRHCLSHSVTTIQGRCEVEVTVSDFGPGNYRVVYETGPYFQKQGVPTFYPEQEVIFTKTDADAELVRFQVPSLGSPFGTTAYKGSSQRNL